MKNKRPRSRDLRKGRVSESGRMYLITTVTHERKPVFSDWDIGRVLVRTLMKESLCAETLAYVVMPDHLHWLMQLQHGVLLSKVMRSVKAVSGHRINARLNKSGKIWQAGYHDHALRKEDNLISVARYIVANPLRAGLVSRIGDYSLWDAVWI